MLQLLEYVDPARAGHDDIEQHDVGRRGAERREALLPGRGRPHDMPVPLEAPGQDGPIDRVVVDDQHDAAAVAHRVAGPSLRGRAVEQRRPAAGARPSDHYERILI